MKQGLLPAALILLAAADAGAGRLSGPVGSIAVPAGWHQQGPSRSRMLLVSPGPGAEGVVIGRRQAMILVAPIDGWRRNDVDASVKAMTGDDRVLSRRQVRLAAADCPVATQVETEAEIGPGARQRNVALYCPGRPVLVQVTWWASNRATTAYRAALTGVARSYLGP